jgi:hypothetical protein
MRLPWLDAREKREIDGCQTLWLRSFCSAGNVSLPPVGYAGHARRASLLELLVLLRGVAASQLVIRIVSCVRSNNAKRAGQPAPIIGTKHGELRPPSLISPSRMKRSMCHWPTLLSQYPPSAIHFSHPRSEPATVRSAAFRLCTTLGACSAVTIDRAFLRTA